jgi:hypothetical protein
LSLDSCNLLCLVHPSDCGDSTQEQLTSYFEICRICHTYEDALAATKEISFHVAMVGIDDSSLGGLKIIQALQSAHPDLPVIIVSSLDNDGIDASIGDLKYDGVMPANADKRTILERIKMVEPKIDALLQKSVVTTRDETRLDKSLSIEESIEHFFKKTLVDLAQFDTTDKFNRKMDFNVMKMFLFTAFNNFKEMDPTFEDEQMKFAKQKLESCIKLQHDMQRRTGYAMESNYEHIFLFRQIPYLEMQEEYDEIKKKLETLRHELAYFTRQMEEAKEKMKLSPKGSDSYVKYEQDFKRANGKNVDRVHAIKENTAQFESLDEKMELFRKEHFPAFKKVFTESTEEIKTDIQNALDLLAYKFDMQIWRRAKKSRNVRDFFASARIKGLFSSKTYLEYFVGNLDSKVASPSNMKMIKYLNEYNTTNKIYVAVLGNDTMEIGQDKVMIERIDKAIEVHGYINPDMLIKKFETTYYKVIMVYTEITPHVNALQFADSFKQKFVDVFEDVSLVLKYEKGRSKKSFTGAVTHGYRHFIENNATRENYIQLMLDAL